jgi:hypothetical protein
VPLSSRSLGQCLQEHNPALLADSLPAHASCHGPLHLGANMCVPMVGVRQLSCCSCAGSALQGVQALQQVQQAASNCSVAHANRHLTNHLVLAASFWAVACDTALCIYACLHCLLTHLQSTTRVKPFITTMPMRLDEGWNQIQFNLADFTRRAYGGCSTIQYSWQLSTAGTVMHLSVDCLACTSRFHRLHAHEACTVASSNPPELKCYKTTTCCCCCAAPSCRHQLH